MIIFLYQISDVTRVIEPSNAEGFRAIIWPKNELRASEMEMIDYPALRVSKSDKEGLEFRRSYFRVKRHYTSHQPIMHIKPQHHSHIISAVNVVEGTLYVASYVSFSSLSYPLCFVILVFVWLRIDGKLSNNAMMSPVPVLFCCLFYLVPFLHLTHQLLKYQKVP